MTRERRTYNRKLSSDESSKEVTIKVECDSGPGFTGDMADFEDNDVSLNEAAPEKSLKKYVDANSELVLSLQAAGTASGETVNLKIFINDTLLDPAMSGVTDEQGIQFIATLQFSV